MGWLEQRWCAAGALALCAGCSGSSDEPVSAPTTTPTALATVAENGDAEQVARPPVPPTLQVEYDGGVLTVQSIGGTWAPRTSPTRMAIDGTLQPDHFIADTGSSHIDLSLSDPAWRITSVTFQAAEETWPVPTAVEATPQQGRVEFPAPMCANLGVTAVGIDYEAGYSVRVGVAGAPCSPFDDDT